MKQNIHLKRLMIILLILLGISLSVRSYFEREAKLIRKEQQATQNSTQIESRNIERFRNIFSAQSSAGEIKPLKQLQMDFIYGFRDIAAQHHVTVSKVGMMTRNLEEPQTAIENVSGVESLSFEFRVTSHDYQGLKDFFSEIKTKFPVRLDRITILYPDVDGVITLLGSH